MFQDLHFRNFPVFHDKIFKIPQSFTQQTFQEFIKSQLFRLRLNLPRGPYIFQDKSFVCLQILLSIKKQESKTAVRRIYYKKID